MQNTHLSPPPDAELRRNQVVVGAGLVAVAVGGTGGVVVWPDVVARVLGGVVGFEVGAAVGESVVG